MEALKIRLVSVLKAFCDLIPTFTYSFIAWNPMNVVESHGVPTPTCLADALISAYDNLSTLPTNPKPGSAFVDVSHFSKLPVSILGPSPKLDLISPPTLCSAYIA